jgi:TolA-binding protein
MTQCDLGSEPAERYVARTMPELERTGFEEHFFACDACFRAVQALDAARRVLADQGSATAAAAGAGAGATPGAPGRGFPYRWMALAATLVVVAGLSVVVRRTPMPADVATSPAVPAEVPAPQPQIAPSVPEAQARVPVADPAASPKPPSTQGRLERWAVVSPPQYVALTSRSGQDPQEDENVRKFDEAMAHYSARRYRPAADGLQALADRAPAAAHVQFFLGISELMSGNVARARGALQRAAESGVSPYADEAHFYLAKAALRAGDLTAAARELQLAVEREAGPEGEAAKLLAELRRVAR